MICRPDRIRRCCHLVTPMVGLGGKHRAVPIFEYYGIVDISGIVGSGISSVACAAYNRLVPPSEGIGVDMIRCLNRICGNRDLITQVILSGSDLDIPIQKRDGIMYTVRLINGRNRLLEGIPTGTQIAHQAFLFAGRLCDLSSINTAGMLYMLQSKGILLRIYNTHRIGGDFIVFLRRLQRFPDDPHQRQILSVIRLHVDIGESDRTTVKIVINYDHSTLFHQSLRRCHADAAQNAGVIGKGKIRCCDSGTGFQTEYGAGLSANHQSVGTEKRIWLILCLRELLEC